MSSTCGIRKKKPRVVALVPMKHTSVRVPGKNFRDFCGRPLFHWVIGMLLDCSGIAEVVVDTDSSEIKAGLAEHFPAVRVIDRPAHLLDDPPMNEILLHDTAEVSSDIYLQTHSTNPFLRKETVEGALKAFFDNYPQHDSLFTVTRAQKRMYDQLGRAINHNPRVLLRTQDLPPVYEENSCVYVFTRDTLVENHHRIGLRPYMFPMPVLESQDIDTEFEFEVAAHTGLKLGLGKDSLPRRKAAGTIVLKGSEVLAVRPVQPAKAEHTPTHSVLLSAPYIMPHLARFVPVLESFGLNVIVASVNERLEEEDLLSFAGQFDGIICGDDQFTEKVYKEWTPRLKVVSKWGTGIDSINKPLAETYGVVVGNTNNAFTKPVADSVMGYILSFARQQPWMDRGMKQGTWCKILGKSLSECTVGVIGVGNIGKAVLTRAGAFGATLLGTDIVEVDSEFVQRVGVSMVSLEELLRTSDFVSINCTLTEESRHIINDYTIGLMKTGAVLINTARGPHVKETALVKALQSGKLGGAGLDVFEDEPLPSSSILYKMDNVMMAAHNSNSSPVAHENVQWNTIRNLVKALGIPSEDYAYTAPPDAYSSLKFENQMTEKTNKLKPAEDSPPSIAPPVAAPVNQGLSKRKVAVVTGALGGIGSATVTVLQEHGYLVVGLDKLGGSGSGCDHLFEVDIQDFGAQETEKVSQVIKEVRNILKGSLDLLVNNAAHQVIKPFEELNLEDWDTTVRTNVSAPFHLSQILLPELQAGRGSIVNISSIHANLTKPGFVAYASSKGGLVSLTRAMAVELGAMGVRVNAVLPAATATPMLLEGFKDNPEKFEQLSNFHPIGRIASPREIGEFVAYLASPAAGFITGSALSIDGGIGGRLLDPL